MSADLFSSFGGGVVRRPGIGGRQCPSTALAAFADGIA